MRSIILLLVTVCSPVFGQYTVGPVPDALAQEWKLSPKYKKSIVVGGLPILATEKVNDYALKEAAYLVDRLLAGREDVRQAIVKNRVRFAVMSFNEYTLDVPEHSDLTPAAYWNKRARGLGATRARPAVSCGEENLLKFPGDPYSTESIAIHEFAHVIDEMGLRSVNKDHQKRLKMLYEEAQREGLWKNTYAMSNPQEYWAEAVQSWFHCNRTNDNQHNDINSRDALRKYDPRMAKFLEESFPKNDWIYLPPPKRGATEHLKGYDPTKAPTFRWPEKMVRDYEEFQKKK